MKTIFILLAFTFLARIDVFSCTAFCLRNQENIIVAKNLDWETDQGFVMANPSGIHKESFTLKGKVIEWTSRYPSLTFNQFGKEFPLGGMNGWGLAMEELNNERVELYLDSNLNQLNEFQIVQFVLDNCKSVKEAISLVEEIQQEAIVQSLHYLIADSTGVCAVIEFDGHGFKSTICTGSNYPVLSNNRYSESLKYLRFFEGYGGNLPVVKRPGSNERFVYAVEMLNTFSNQNPVEYSFHALDSIRQEDTRWSIVYDLKKKKIYFRFHACNRIKVFDMALIDFPSLEQTIGCNLANCSCLGVMHFSAISPEENSGLLKNISVEMDASIQKILSRMAFYGNRFLK
ncbi:MAG: linear amide C-N hydrolase [Bacteroides sp.]|jgi:choloylglycine hydrolase|nr:linear amide C-N hydrolase [Bacteroides sp.]